MIEVKNIKLMDKLYTTKTHKSFEVIKETDNCFYLAVFDGGCSKITYISKILAELDANWFLTKEEANKHEVKELRRMANYIEDKELSK